MSISIEGDAPAPACLSAAERTRAAAFLHPPSRARFVAGRAALRGILAAYLGGASNDLAIDTDEFGKPWVAGAPCFNVSHSADRAVVAVAMSPVGVDIERIDERPGLLAIVEGFFADAEVTALRRHDRDSFAPSFFGCWTRKEALIKAVGSGLGVPLRAFEVSVPPAPASLVGSQDDRLRVGAWDLRDVDAGPGFAGAVAAFGRIEHVVARVWPIGSCAAERSA